MDKELLNRIKQWFLEYSASFEMEDAGDQEMIELKRAHTLRVADNAVLISKGEGLGEPPAHLAHMAEAAALLHDIGRFSQFTRYRTFNDGQSINHGELGAQVISDEGVLDGLDALDGKIRQNLLDAVRYHNAYSLPDIKDENALLVLKVLRDADKLDIWRVMAEYYELPPSERSPAVANHLEDRPTYSPEMLEKLARGIPCRYSDATVLNDLKFMNLSWAYGLDFSTTCRLLLERRLAERIASTLPDTPEIAAAIGSLISHIQEQSEKG